MSFVITSYFTIDNAYAEVAHKYILSSLNKFTPKLKSDIRGIFSKGGWGANTSYKPEFIKIMLEHHKEDDIIFVDSDAEILAYPSLFENIPKEYFLGAYKLDRNKWYGKEFLESERFELLSGTLFIRNCSQSKAILEEWIRRCFLNPKVWEQKVLYEIIKEKHIKVYELPQEYCRILSMPNGSVPILECNNPVIVHHQISRKLKHRKL